MKGRLKAAGLLFLCGLTFCPGCAELSLFSSTHSHYYGTQAIEERLTSLENRVTALETASGFAPSLPQNAPPLPASSPAK